MWEKNKIKPNHCYIHHIIVWFWTLCCLALLWFYMLWICKMKARSICCLACYKLAVIGRDHVLIASWNCIAVKRTITCWQTVQAIIEQHTVSPGERIYKLLKVFTWLELILEELRQNMSTCRQWNTWLRLDDMKKNNLSQSFVPYWFKWVTCEGILRLHFVQFLSEVVHDKWTLYNCISTK